MIRSGRIFGRSARVTKMDQWIFLNYDDVFCSVHIDALCVLEYLGELCAVQKDDDPFIVHVLDRVCAVSDLQTCAEMHIDATDFAVNPSFSCRVVVCIAL